MMIVYRMSLFGYFQTSFVVTIQNPKFSFYQLKNTPRDVSHMMWLRGRYQTSADRAVRIPSGFTARYLSDIIENLKFSVEGFRVSGFRIWTWFWPTDNAQLFRTVLFADVGSRTVSKSPWTHPFVHQSLSSSGIKIFIPIFIHPFPFPKRFQLS